jgi:hypothetical protein
MTKTLDTSCSENTMVLSARGGVSACMYFLVLTYPVNLPCGRKAEHSEKTYDFRQRVDRLFFTSHFHITRIEPTISKVKGACSDDCTTKAPQKCIKTPNFHPQNLSSGYIVFKLVILLFQIVRLFNCVKKLPPGDFAFESALFVYNKWDQVESDKNVKNADEFKQYITSQLEKYWPSLDSSTQVVEFSTQNAALAQDKSYISEKFVKFMNLLKSMLLRTISAKLKAEWK